MAEVYTINTTNCCIVCTNYQIVAASGSGQVEITYTDCAGDIQSDFFSHGAIVCAREGTVNVLTPEDSVIEQGNCN